MASLTLYQRHVVAWQDCRRCLLCEGRAKVVLGRGKLPCDVLFIGEGPGESENVLGIPFVGPAGHLLDHIIRQALPDGMRYAITNLVGCIPRENGDKATEPPDEAIIACWPRLVDMVKIADPKLLVAVGALAKNWLEAGAMKTWAREKFHKKIPIVDIIHPAAILRGNLAMRGLAIQRCIVKLANAVEKFLQRSNHVESQ